MLHLVGYFCMN